MATHFIPPSLEVSCNYYRFFHQGISYLTARFRNSPLETEKWGIPAFRYTNQWNKHVLHTLFLSLLTQKQLFPLQKKAQFICCCEGLNYHSVVYFGELCQFPLRLFYHYKWHVTCGLFELIFIQRGRKCNIF